MARAKNPAERWLWFSSKTGVCVPLDPAAYPTRALPKSTYGPEFILFPSWACQKANGGVHIDRRVGRIDVDAAKTPLSRIELNWTCNYGVKIVAKAWLAEFRDLIDESKTQIGEVRRQGRPLENWATLHEANAPPMFGSEGWATQCPICGDIDAMVAGRNFFVNPTVVGRPVIVNTFGVFVREDLALARNLRTPRGAFKPSVVRFLAKPPAIRAPPDWASGSAPDRSSDEARSSQPAWRRLASAAWKALRG